MSIWLRFGQASGEMSLQEDRWLTWPADSAIHLFGHSSSRASCVLLFMPMAPMGFQVAHSRCPQVPHSATSCPGAHCLDPKEDEILHDKLWFRASEHFRTCFFLSHVWRVLLVAVRRHDNGQLLSTSSHVERARVALCSSPHLVLTRPLEDETQCPSSCLPW